MVEEPAFAAQMMAAFNIVFDSYVEGEARSSIAARLSAEVERRGIPGFGPEFAEELAEAVEDRTRVWLAT